jgi:hypothetical protein
VSAAPSACHRAQRREQAEALGALAVVDLRLGRRGLSHHMAHRRVGDLPDPVRQVDL